MLSPLVTHFDAVLFGVFCSFSEASYKTVGDNSSLASCCTVDHFFWGGGGVGALGTSRGHTVSTSRALTP